MSIEEYIYTLLAEIREYDTDLSYDLLERLDSIHDKTLLANIHKHIGDQGGL